MRVALIFFLSLFFYVLGSQGSACVSNRHCDTGLAAKNIQKAQQVESTNTTRGYLLTKQADTDHQNEYVISDRDEDEDITRRHIVPVSHFEAFTCVFNSSHFCNFLADRLSFYKSPAYAGSPKYLVQRVWKL